MRNRILALAAVWGLFAVPAAAQVTSVTEIITVSSSAVSIADATLRFNGQQANTCFFTVRDAAVRMRYDGLAPTTLVGHVFPASASFPIVGAAELRQIKMIRDDGTDAEVTVTCSIGTDAPVGVGGSPSAGGGDATAANQTTEISHLATMSGGVSGSLYQVNVSQVGGATPATETTFDFNDSGTTQTRAAIGSAVPSAAGAVIVRGAEDEPAASGDGLVGIACVRRDTAASSSGTAGDYSTCNVDNLGRIWITNGGPCADPARILHAAISESTAATNEIVALNGSDLIYVCSYKWVTTAANSLSWARGTGVDCGTGTTAIEGAQPFGANGGVTEQGGGAPLFVVPAGNALCLTSSAATAHGGRVSYVRTAAP